MLLRFKVSNFRSFGDKTEISLLAGSPVAKCVVPDDVSKLL